MPDVIVTRSGDGPVYRCGGSSNKPACDGTRAAIDFDGTSRTHRGSCQHRDNSARA
jgi:CDGSH-type Zn-finger protein